MNIKIDNLSFDENGLIPAIVQDENNGNVLMHAYMNEEALHKTIETKETWLYSRSRQELWNKGATSGNRQIVKRISLDCDQDALLIEVEPMGPACHTGEESCFFNTILEEHPSNRQVIRDIVATIKQRRNESKEGSYTSYLFRKGIDKVLKKVGEETSEVIIGAKNDHKQELTSELADLTYHTLVLMEMAGVTVDDVKHELKKRRMKESGDT